MRDDLRREDVQDELNEGSTAVRMCSPKIPLKKKIKKSHVIGNKRFILLQIASIFTWKSSRSGRRAINTGKTLKPVLSTIVNQ